MLLSATFALLAVALTDVRALSFPRDPTAAPVIRAQSQYSQDHLDELWAKVEAKRPVEVANVTHVVDAPKDIYVPEDPANLPGNPDYHSKTNKVSGLKFPKGFKYGVASAAIQVEGAVKTDGRGPSIWDYVAHVYPQTIGDQTTPDVSDNHYYLYKEDIARIKKMGVTSYSFSISWSRVLPFGRGPANEKGLDFYDRLINATIEAGLEPVATLFHWDVPLNLELEYGSYRSPRIVDDYLHYASMMFKRYGDRVKTWVTHNEPGVFCPRYSNTLPLNATNPTNLTDVQSYFACVYHLLKAHGSASKLYHTLSENGTIARGDIGLKLDNSYPLPYDKDDPQDVENAARANAFNVGLYAEPVYGSGDWPQIIKDSVPASALKPLTSADKALIKGSADYLALDGYDVRIAKALPKEEYEACKKNVEDKAWPTCSDTSRLAYSQSLKGGWVLGQQADPNAPWLYNSAGALRAYWKSLYSTYPSPKLYLSEFGWGEAYENAKSEIHAIRQDDGRSKYMIDYTSELLLSIHEDGLPWKGFFAWSLLDNWEWYVGKQLRFGLQYVNYSDPNLARHYKRSFLELRDFMDEHLDW